MPLKTNPIWKMTTQDGDPVHVSAHPQDRVVVLKVDHYAYARLTPIEAREVSRQLAEGADAVERRRT